MAHDRRLVPRGGDGCSVDVLVVHFQSRAQSGTPQPCGHDGASINDPRLRRRRKVYSPTMDAPRWYWPDA